MAGWLLPPASRLTVRQGAREARGTRGHWEGRQEVAPLLPGTTIVRVGGTGPSAFQRCPARGTARMRGSDVRWGVCCKKKEIKVG